ncbi:MAG: DUF2917 domain-containing protein [Pseudomonadota bacterium]
MNSLIDDLLGLQTQVALRLTPLRFALLQRMRTGDESSQPATPRKELASLELACETTGAVQSRHAISERSGISLGTAGQDHRVVIRLVAHQHVDLRCTHGVLWVTVRGSVKDWILYPGYRVVLSPGQEATATGLPCGDLCVERAGGSAD